MIRIGWRLGFFCWVISLAVGQASAQTPTISLVPTIPHTQRCFGGPEDGLACSSTADCERDGSNVLHPECVRVCQLGDNDGDPCNSIADCPGGGNCVQSCFCNRQVTNPPPFFMAEVRGRNWSPDNQAIVAYQAVVDFASSCAAIKPFGWDRPCSLADEVLCEENTDCPPAYPICGPSELCEGVNHDPTLGAFIDDSNPNYVFFNMTNLPAVDVSSLAFRYASLLVTGVGVPFTTEKYFGTATLVPETGAAACGRRSIGLVSPRASGMSDQNSADVAPLDLEGVTVVFAQECICDQIVSSTPSACTIDARQNSEPDGSSSAGWSSVELEMNFDNCNLTCDSFNIREVPGNVPVSCTGVENNVPAPGWVTVSFATSTPGVWTCIRRGNHAASEVCLGGLPGDADLDGTVEAADLTTLVDCVSGAESCDTMQCDMDRSGICGAGDIVRAVDLLGGAESYAIWIAQSLGACPNP